MAQGAEKDDDDVGRIRVSHDENEGRNGLMNNEDNVPTNTCAVSEESNDDVERGAINSQTIVPDYSERETGNESPLERQASSKKRKSDEISRDAEGACEATPSSPSHSGDVNTSTGDNVEQSTTGSKEGAASKPDDHSKPHRSSAIRSQSQSRKRGMSLRSSLFTKNLYHRSRTNSLSIEMGAVTPPNVAKILDKKTTSEASVTAMAALDKFESNVSDTTPSHGKLLSSEFSGVSPLPNYQQWARERANRHLPINRIKEAYKRARKFVLRIQEIPPSKDGRHIPLGPSRKESLIDDRTGHPYMNNLIKSSKYNAWNFLPRQLFAQFSKLANCYFLFVSILQMIPGLSTTGQYTTIVPLMFFVSISMAKEGYEDLRRHKLDKSENNREAKVLHTRRPLAPSDGDKVEREQGTGSHYWAPVKWQSLQVGDIIKLERDEAAPADLLLLDSKGENNVAYIETLALDGETNLKTKQPSGTIRGTCSSTETISDLGDSHVIIEDPNLDLYNFEGKIALEGTGAAPLTNNEVIYRGSILRNTPELYGLVMYSGEECKIRMNANKNPRIKAPALQGVVNKIVIMMVIFVIALSLFCTIAYQIWRTGTEEKAWYLTHARVPFGHVLTSFIIMFNTLIPLSLYVSLEIIKLGQMFLFNDIDMYDEASNTPFKAQTSTINEELGQVSYIFSDKTGTLTENVMRFRKISVAGTAWLHDVDLASETKDEELPSNKKRKVVSKGKRSLHPFSRKSNSEAVDVIDRTRKQSTATRSIAASRRLAQPEELSTNDMIRYIQRKPNTHFARKARMMILSIALCHTCLPERREDGNVTYQASSPDELALVRAAGELGYLAYDRELSTLTLKTFPNGLNKEAVLEKYEILDVVDFSSKRKRMSVIVRFPHGRICVICKGADQVIMERLRLASLAIEKVAEIEQRVNQRRSMEAQLAMERKSSAAGRSPRTSQSHGRPSMGRASIGRLAPIRDDVDGWMKEREPDVPTSVDPRHYSPRPSAQLSRPSAAWSERSHLEPESEDDALVQEDLVTNDGLVIERCFQHIHDYAVQGLRTLLYGYRFLDEEEYQSWKKVYQDATTSLVDRQQRIEDAGELIEQQLELAGATAIEDKLQQGVPETIDRLRRANIKLWMLTGDKRETAINIGYSCRLIKDYSTVTILDYEAGGAEQKIAAAVLDINAGSVAHSVIVIDGRTLGMLQSDDSSHSLFLDLAILADSVVCCRASPSQKAGLVRAIRRRVNRSVTLAIGDGANDIAMIQEAHVGIGITGKEGLQAARVSDYAIAQFRFLNKLLLVHGRWNYIRTAKYTVATFWKEMLFYLTQSLYQRWNGYTGTSLYEQWSLSQFNTLFTSLPVIFLGIFEKDLAAATLIAVPELYTKGQRFAAFNFKVYWSWMFMAATEAMIVFFVMKCLFGEVIFTAGRDLFAMGTMTFSACVILINIKLQMLEQHNRTIIAFLCLFIEIGGWFLWNIIFNYMYGDNYEYNVKGGIVDRFGENALWWLCLILSVASCALFEILVRAGKNALFPTDVEIFQELEKDPAVRRRFEEASASELQAGWYYGRNNESKVEQQSEAEREGEVQDLLNRPRVVEEGRNGSPRKKSDVVETAEVEAKEDDTPIRRSSDIHEMLSRRFGSIRRESLQERRE